MSSPVTDAAGAPTHPTSFDRLRQVAVTLSMIACLLGPLIGAGLIGDDVEDTGDGELSADSTLLAPGGPAFSIWSVIYLGLLAYTVWQWLPSRAADPRTRATGWLAASSMLLNACWLLVTQQDWIWTSVAVIAVLALVLGFLVLRLTEVPARYGFGETLVVDGTFGLYLGWVAVATAANVAAAIVSTGVEPVGTAAEWTAVVVVLVLAGVLAWIQSRVGGRWAVAAAAAWGLSWISIARATDRPESAVVAVAAAVAAVLVVVATAVLRRRGSAAVDRREPVAASR